MSGSSKALAMWGAQQLTLAGEAIPESTKKACGDGLSTAVASAKSKPAKKYPQIHIEGRRWFQKTFGNTYHSVRILVDGKQVCYLPFTYGYCEQFLQTAWEWLAANGFPELDERHANGSRKNYGTQYLRDVMGGSYSVIDVQRKKDL